MFIGWKTMVHFRFLDKSSRENYNSDCFLFISDICVCVCQDLAFSHCKNTQHLCGTIVVWNLDISSVLKDFGWRWPSTSCLCVHVYLLVRTNTIVPTDTALHMYVHRSHTLDIKNPNSFMKFLIKLVFIFFIVRKEALW